MTREDVADIETIVRQAWCPAESSFASWLSVDQEQALALIRMIPNRLAAYPKPLFASSEVHAAPNKKQRNGAKIIP